MGFDMILECHREPENYFVRNALQIGVPVLRRLREVADVLVMEDPPETVHSTRYCRQNYKKGSCYFVSTRRQSARLTVFTLDHCTMDISVKGMDQNLTVSIL